MTVRERVDQLTSEPAVGDLGYSADQRLVATALLGLQLLADEIDDIKDSMVGLSKTESTDDGGEFAEQLADLTVQVKKLKKAVKKFAKLEKSKKLESKKKKDRK